MSEVSDVQQETVVEESTEKTGSELDRYIAQQPRTIRIAHVLMLALEAVAAILYIGLFILAIYVSVTWKTHGELAVPRWWMASQVCAGLLLVFVGLHTLVVKAYSPTPPGTRDSIVTGREAVRKAWGPLALGLFWAAAWGGMYLFIVLSGADPIRTFIPFVVIVSIGLGVAWSIWVAIQKRRRSQ
ncbi:MAG: hypothetical protein GWN58_30270 [Anaerolineae bacterium]|nr:hypothetical protein [Anaerolineae bacterium]